MSLLLKIRRPLDPPNDIIPLREKGNPVVERALLLVGQVLPLGADVLGLGRRLAEGARGVVAGEDYFALLGSMFYPWGVWER